jgi:excisionase family DNA binding protein
MMSNCTCATIRRCSLNGDTMQKTTGTSLSDQPPLLVKPKRACQILNCGNTRLYELLAAGELQSFKDGRSRQIVVQSIHSYIARRLADQAQ